ncbi:hypothetical protein NC652_002936 [Populus alba x Populus x berolinensis]|nr:hypothetical protein NC652_002936 [Populus alba x Populus x berolinensis]
MTVEFLRLKATHQTARGWRQKEQDHVNHPLPPFKELPWEKELDKFCYLGRMAL